MLRPIDRLVPNGGLAPTVANRLFYCYDLAYCFSPLMGQSNERRSFWGHVLNRLHDGLESHDVEFWIQILNEYVARCLSIRRFRSPDSWVLTRAVLRRCSYGGHHVDATVLDSRVLTDAAPDLRIVFSGISIRRRSRRGTRCSNRGLEDGCPDQESLQCHGGEVV
jgi:hypothetical protein